MIDTLLDRRYKIVRTLSEGGFGHTYVALDTRRPGNPACAVKQLKPATSDRNFLPTARRLFKSEAEALEKLGDCDAIPRLLAYFEENGEFFLVEELIEGQPLSTELLPGQLWSEEQVIQLLQEILSILAFVHQNGAIHRDIKPDNIIRRTADGRLVLVDFGAVKQVQMQANVAREALYNETVAIGTPGYMPSEQSQGRPRPSSDIYALGVIAIQALTGLHPVQLAEDPETGELIWRDRAQVSDRLAAIVSQMVRHYFKYRYQSATEVLQALKPLTQPPTLANWAIAARQLSRYYLETSYQRARSAVRAIASPGTSPPTHRPDPSVPPTQNTITVVTNNPTPSSPQPRPLALHPSQWPGSVRVGTVAAVIAIAALSFLRPAVLSSKNANPLATPTATTETDSNSQSCVVVVRPTNLRAGSSRTKTGKVIPAGTTVSITGREENGWLEIRSPESGWIWKSRTNNTCEGSS